MAENCLFLWWLRCLLKLFCFYVISCLLSHILKGDLLTGVVSEEYLFTFKLHTRIYVIYLIQPEINKALIKFLVVGNIILPPMSKTWKYIKCLFRFIIHFFILSNAIWIDVVSFLFILALITVLVHQLSRVLLILTTLSLDVTIIRVGTYIISLRFIIEI